MVIAWLEVGAEVHVPLEEVSRRVLAPALAAGVRLDPLELGVVGSFGYVSPTESEMYATGAGAGSALLVGARGAWRLRVGSLIVRPGARLAYDHRERIDYWYGEPYFEHGLEAGAGCDLVVPLSPTTWATVGAVGGWNTVDAAPFVVLRVSVGADAVWR